MVFHGFFSFVHTIYPTKFFIDFFLNICHLLMSSLVLAPSMSSSHVCVQHTRGVLLSCLWL